MPLSTSNFDIQVPSLKYKRLWALAIVAALLALSGMECYWRARGFLPSVTDDLALWACHRGNVYSIGETKKMVVIGSSRGQLDLVPEIINNEIPNYRMVQLCLDGPFPIETLEHLANDQRFDGAVLCDILSERCLEIKEEKKGQKAWCDYYDRYWTNLGRIDKSINVGIKAFLQERLNVCSSNMLLIRQISSWRYLKPMYLYMRADRSRSAFYYERMTGEELENHKNRRAKATEGIFEEHKRMNLGNMERFNREMSTRIRSAVERIQARSGEVIFIKMPVTGEVANIENSMYPREKFWDFIAPLTGAKTIHYEDYPGLNGFVCPDGSHLDYSDAKVFSGEVGRIIAKILGI